MIATEMATPFDAKAFLGALSPEDRKGLLKALRVTNRNASPEVVAARAALDAFEKANAVVLAEHQTLLAALKSLRGHRDTKPYQHDGEFNIIVLECGHRVDTRKAKWRNEMWKRGYFVSQTNSVHKEKVRVAKGTRKPTSTIVE